MLKYTFRHIPGYGEIKEVDLWKSGVLTWQEFLSRNQVQLNIFESTPLGTLLHESFEAYEKRDADFFAKTLAASEFYRVALSFPEDVMFLDIETTGLSRYYDHITLIGWSFLKEFDVYYKGLSTDELYAAFKRAKCLVTFNGSIFDIPFIKKEFPELKIPICHIDLRFFAKRHGFSGGQKSIEKEIKFERSYIAGKITGEIAPVLWHRYKEGDIEALKKLIIYNQFDIDGMKSLLDVCIKLSIEKLPLLNGILKPIVFSKYNSKYSFTEKPSKKGIYLKMFEGKLGPTITLKDLPKYQNLSIVGIDLTGSEERATGWCHLMYDHAVTKRINKTKDIIEETLKHKPDIISIDSPLSLPEGRNTVFDDDISRDEFGIMRVCERILKRRGVSVYPSLIPSMQKLTLRGIKLADEFRKRGIPVVESYPGAAQDILGIPRKRASLEYLTKGLSSFGIHGNYESTEVSHDELDAITSAMLGYFWWCGKFEALGNEKEDYLIIPDIHKSFPDWENIQVIGISGGLATGKTTAGLYLESKRFSYGRFSMVLEKLLLQEEKLPTRFNLQAKGESIHATKGQRWLCKQLVYQLFNDQQKLVIDGLRWPEDHAYFKELYGQHFKHVHLQCNNEIRKNRYLNLKKNDISFEQAITHAVEKEVDNLYMLADTVIINDKNLSYLYQELDKITN